MLSVKNVVRRNAPSRGRCGKNIGDMTPIQDREVEAHEKRDAGNVHRDVAGTLALAAQNTIGARTEVIDYVGIPVVDVILGIEKDETMIEMIENAIEMTSNGMKPTHRMRLRAMV
jgi:hypothetical protein